MQPITIQISLPEGFEGLFKEFMDRLGVGVQENVATVPDEIMTVDDVCREFKIPKTKIYAMTMKTGPESIPRFKVGRDLRFKRSDLVEWFNSKKVI